MTYTLYYTDHHEVVLPPGHKFPMPKYRLVRELLGSNGHFRFVPAPEADPETIALAHDRSYVESFLQGTLATPVMRRIGFPWSETLVQRTLSSVGGTLQATRDALSSGTFGGTLAGGTHHAFPAEGSGFCVFNDIAVAIRALQHENRLRRYAVVDLDVHQGDGTALFFEDDPAVLTLSMHGRNNFPFRKQRSKLDIELEDRTGDEEYLRMLEDVLPRVANFDPEIIFYQSGVDALCCDRLGRLELTHEGLKQRDTIVAGLARDLRVPLVVTLGGGYGDPIEATALAHANTFKVISSLMK
ncbi:MAG TPA: histone deacetylase [Terriglobales bacterium]|nr:histone deacetylase [Terriglobales bacterium]